MLEIISDASYFEKTAMESMRSMLLGTGRGKRLLKPYGVAADSAGRVYITDTGLGTVVVFDKVEGKVRTIGGSGQGRLFLPIGVAVAGEIIFVSDARLNRVYGFDLQ
ncbi:MAG: hypothetical protein ACE5LH_09865, partial [Fidelibacterota bacterium]